MWSRRFGRPNQIHESTGKITMNFDRIPLSDRKSTRLNSSHVRISYAVFCLKKKTSYQVGSLNRQQMTSIASAPARHGHPAYGPPLPDMTRYRGSSLEKRSPPRQVATVVPRN